MNIFIENETGSELPGNYEAIVKDVVAASLDFLKCPYECDVEVLFVDNAGIAEINREYRDIDSPTDVLSFPMIEYEVPGDFSVIEEAPDEYLDLDTGNLVLGNIILNIDRIVSQAEEYGHTKRRELAFLTAHSMLHLAGYDHMEEEERVQMEKLQEEILNINGYTRDNEQE